MCTKDDQSYDNNSGYGNNKFITQYNFGYKSGKNKIGKKQRKSEKPKDQFGIESFFLNKNNNNKENKKIWKNFFNFPISSGLLSQR